MTPLVIPAEAGIQSRCRIVRVAPPARLDRCVHGNDGLEALRA